jgi:hypothetical protein
MMSLSRGSEATSNFKWLFANAHLSKIIANSDLVHDPNKKCFHYSAKQQEATANIGISTPQNFERPHILFSLLIIKT